MAEISGRGGNFRFVTIFEKNQYGQTAQRMVFMLHEPMVLVREVPYKYSLDQEGNLLIYQTDTYNRENITGRVIKSDHPVVKELKEAILEDSLEEMLIKE